MTPSLEGWPTKAKEAPSPHEIRMSPLDTDPVFQSLGGTHQKSLKQHTRKILSNTPGKFYTLTSNQIGS